MEEHVWGSLRGRKGLERMGGAVPGVPRRMQGSWRGWKGQVWGSLRDWGSHCRSLRGRAQGAEEITGLATS